MIELTEKIIPTDNQLKEAIALRCSKVFPALNIANSLAGSENVAWKLLRQFSLVALVIEAEARKLDLANLDCAVEGGKVITSQMYLAARKAMVSK